MDRTKFCTKAEVSRLFSIRPMLVEKIMERNGIKPFRVPGHSRTYFRRSEIQRLLAAADLGAEFATGARA